MNLSLYRFLRAARGVLRRFFTKTPPPYLTLCGFVLMADGWGKIAVSILKAMENQFPIGFISTRSQNDFSDVPVSFQNTLKRKSAPGKVILFTDSAWGSLKQPLLEKLIAEKHSADKIRIAYSMFESTKIPSFWTEIFHRYFDAIVVPDPYFIEVYKNSGVKIPIFSLPICVDYDPFLNKPLKTNKNSPMVFADFSVFASRKNHLTLIHAFAKAFGNNPDVLLRLNGRYGQGDCRQKVLEEAARLKLNNLIVTERSLSFDDYLKLFQTVDCYVNLSKGEGFSIPPREAMAQGIPVICADHTALSTICKTGWVRSVPAPEIEPAYYHWPGKTYFGNQFNCSIDEAAKALREVYDHYPEFLAKGKQARDWVAQNDYRQLAPLYRSLVQPKKVIFGSENRITDEYLMTDSLPLYQKYL